MTIIERAQLHEQLRTAVPRSTVYTDTTVCTLDQSRGEIEVELNDGVREQFDVVVGADGVRSRVRELVGAGKKQFCSTTSWTFRIGPDIDTPDSISDIWAPDGKAFFHVPLGERSLGWLVTCTDEREAYDEYTIPDLRETFSGIEWLLPEALDTLDPEETRHSDDYRIRTDEWVNGRVTLLGDAAHAMHPISGVGASLAIEDAYTLADELAARDDDVAVRLADYVGRRRSRIRQLQHYARLSTPFAATESKLFTAIPDALAVRSYALKSSLGERSRQLSKNGASGTSASGKNSETSEGDDE
jgi:2-polyprenyl-6-methoxyphenol hydroxylase-like FAD-dependent oxidoreductase